MSALVNLEQGSQEWLAFRQDKITATDAVVIMGDSKWKTPYQLYIEKTSQVEEKTRNEAMQRGLDLEPIARELFELKMNVEVFPQVVVKDDWAMASLDGLSPLGNLAVEIKCPGPKDHEIALSGKVPSHYYPQLQHQLYVTDLPKMYYFSFDGDDGVVVTVDRDQKYIDKMVAAEKQFLCCLRDKVPPDLTSDDFILQDSPEWTQIANQWTSVKRLLKKLQDDEENLRDMLIQLAGKSNTKGAGISLCKVVRKGNVDYSKIPELKNVDLERYRKGDSEYWKISEM